MIFEVVRTIIRYDIIFSPEAAEDLHGFKSIFRTEILETIETHLRYAPEHVSRSRIKRLRELIHPQYRLRVGADIRVFYDVISHRVEVLAIVEKSRAHLWLERYGEKDEESNA